MAEQRLAYKKPAAPDALTPFDENILSEIKAIAEKYPAAWRWIVFDLCGTYQQGIFQSARDTDIALGKRWVGLQLAGVANYRAVENKEPGS